MLLQQRQANAWFRETTTGANAPEHSENAITDRQFAIFIASYYRATVADEAVWNSPIALSMIKGDQRRFAEQSVAEYPAPTKEEITDADAALRPYRDVLEASPPPLPRRTNTPFW